jgi:hypothetical protein
LAAFDWPISTATSVRAVCGGQGTSALGKPTSWSSSLYFAGGTGSPGALVEAGSAFFA